MRYVFRAVVLAFLISCAILINVSTNTFSSLFERSSCDDTKLCVVFFDVGQGDAIFIQSPTGYQVLIDGGRDDRILEHLTKELSFFDRHLDMVIATHPDADHIGGLIDVFTRYDVGTIVMTDNAHDTPVEDAFDGSVEREGAAIVEASRGQTYDLGGEATLEILFPDREVRDIESNTSSIVAQLRYGGTGFLFTGDAPKSVEEYLVILDGAHLESDVLKLGHHGSRTSTSESFLNEVAPAYAIVSAGKGNSYGHPHEEVTDLLFNNQVVLKSTIESGSVVVHSDGRDVMFQ